MKSSEDLKYLIYSVSFHAVLFFIFAVKIFFFPTQRVDYSRSVRVDFIALPDKEPVEAPIGNSTVTEKTPEPEPAPQTPPPTPKPTPAAPKDTDEPKFVEKPNKKEKPNPSPVKEKQSAAVQRLEALEKIRKMKDSKTAAAIEGTIYKGNVLSQGASLTGVDKLQHDQYLEKLDQQIKRNWQLPEWLSNKNLSASVIVKFDETGALIEQKLKRSSGNTPFDNQALEAIAQSAPFPPPPESLVSYFKVRGIELRFPE